MPIYDYVCTNCGHEMEVIHPVQGHGPAACPKCGGHMRKAIVAAAVHFKGSGWARKERGTGRPSRPAPSETAGGAEKPAGDKPAASNDSSVSTGGAAGESSKKDGD